MGEGERGVYSRRWESGVEERNESGRDVNGIAEEASQMWSGSGKRVVKSFKRWGKR